MKNLLLLLTLLPIILVCSCVDRTNPPSGKWVCESQKVFCELEFGSGNGWIETDDSTLISVKFDMSRGASFTIYTDTSVASLYGIVGSSVTLVEESGEEQNYVAYYGIFKYNKDETAMILTFYENEKVKIELSKTGETPSWVL